mmetsp:Transcript_29062/g.81326  ORF Transcript_29062/g.81326 Transcript_29062/m.81326 type:complete len:201 (-) Transcript_29062:365-967(-)
MLFIHASPQALGRAAAPFPAAACVSSISALLGAGPSRPVNSRTTHTAKASPATLTTVRMRSRSQSTVKMSAMSAAYSSRPTACSTSSMVTRPALGIAAAPTAASVAVRHTTTACPGPSSTPLSWAMKMTVSASYRAVPFMLMVAPSGRTKLQIDSAHPIFCAHSRVTGSVAADESVPKAVTKAGEKPRYTANGFLRTRAT